MFFPTFEFFTFFAFVLILNWYLKRWSFLWRLFLLATSYFFYSFWDFRFLFSLIAVSVFNFFIGLAVFRNFLGIKRIFFALAIFLNILALGFFKYYDFFRVSAEDLFQRLNFSIGLPFFEIILPIGLSFYIFRAISYQVDIYSKKIKPASSLLDFSLYIAFFPHLLSGPITRPGEFLPQLEKGGAKRINNLCENFSLIIIGLFKKLVISTHLSLFIVDDVFAVPENHSSLLIFLAVFAYSLVIYFDFSGYSDMAVGFAGLLGFKLPNNFNFPYLARNIRDFWKKWHITLSDWIKDYVYIPLGGSRKGRIRQYFNLILTMGLVGLWHGPAKHFIIWGLIQGLGLTATHWWQKRKKGDKVIVKKNSLFSECHKSLCWFFTFVFISLSWIFFRSESSREAIAMIKNFFAFKRIAEPLPIYLILIMVIGFLFFAFERKIFSKLTIFQKKLPLAGLYVFIILIVALIFYLSPSTIPSFIYFNF